MGKDNSHEGGAEFFCVIEKNDVKLNQKAIIFNLK